MLKIYGASDDLVELEGFIRDEVDCYDKPVQIKVGTDDSGLIITMRYGVLGAVWSAELSQLDEDVPIPWPVTVVTQGRREDDVGYSVAVCIDCPDDTPVAVRVANEQWRSLGA